MIEILKLKKSKTPLVLEVDVPPLCRPLLVGNPSKDSVLRWVEAPSKRDTVLTWGQECPVEETVARMVTMVIERGAKEGWGIEQPSLASAVERLRSLGITEVESKEGLVYPKDPSFLGSVIVIGDRSFPVLHNVRRGFCVVRS
jgi:hypothetical protein